MKRSTVSIKKVSLKVETKLITKVMIIMGIFDIIILLFFIVVILKQLKHMKELLIPIKKTYAEIITVLFGILIFAYIIHNYANTWFHYIIGVLAIFMFISMWIKQGITLKGFTSMYKYKEIILWNEIEKVIVTNSKDIKVKLFGNFKEQTFYFKKSDYSKIIDMI